MASTKEYLDFRATIQFRRNYVSSYDERIYPLLSRKNCWWYI